VVAAAPLGGPISLRPSPPSSVSPQGIHTQVSLNGAKSISAVAFPPPLNSTKHARTSSPFSGHGNLSFATF